MLINLTTYAVALDLDTAEAIQHADDARWDINTYTDPAEDGRDCDVDHARLVAAEDPSLVYLTLDAPGWGPLSDIGSGEDFQTYPDAEGAGGAYGVIGRPGDWIVAHAADGVEFDGEKIATLYRAIERADAMNGIER